MWRVAASTVPLGIRQRLRKPTKSGQYQQRQDLGGLLTLESGRVSFSPACAHRNSRARAQDSRNRAHVLSFWLQRNMKTILRESCPKRAWDSESTCAVSFLSSGRSRGQPCFKGQDHSPAHPFVACVILSNVLTEKTHVKKWSSRHIIAGTMVRKLRKEVFPERAASS